MCTPDGAGCALAASGGFAGGAGFASVADALRVGRALGAYLNSPAAEALDGPGRGEALEALGAIGSLLGAATNAILRRFDAADDHDADGHPNAATWLAARNHLGRKDARAAVRQMRLLGRHPHLDAATTTGALSISWAREIAAWTGRIDHAELQQKADQILVDAAEAGADLDDLKLLAQAAYEAWRELEPDPDDDPRGRGFPDRHLHLDATLDGAGRIGGDLTPECAAAVTAVLEALGKNRGAGDLRTAGQRYHDALQEACELLIRAKMVPDRAGADTRVDVTTSLRDLLDLDGASVIEDTWLRARAGEHGYLSGADAEAAACDALIVPVVTGSPDWTIISQMITLITSAYPHPRPAAPDEPPQAQDRPGQDEPRQDEPRQDRPGQDEPGQDEPDQDEPDQDAKPGSPGPTDPPDPADPAERPGPRPRPAPQPLPPEAWEALQYALARLAIKFVSGPGALASALRRSLLDAPFNGKSVILDVGYSDTIPESIRRAVIARDKGCAWPGGCNRRPAACDVHHVKHKRHGGKTSTSDCVLLCQYHHDICIHREGWQFELLPDGSTRARSPDGKTTLRSHGPPPTTQPTG